MLEFKQTADMYFNADEIAKAFAHIEALWPVLTRSQTNDDGTLVGLPYDYIVPSSDTESGFVFEEMYYWDSYFTWHGLKQSGRQELAEGMLENLLLLAKRFHIIPNASRFYHTGRSQPPLLSSYIFDIFDTYDKNIAWLQERIHVAEREYQTVWTGTIQPNFRSVYKGLSRYYEINMTDDMAEAESGWDMTTRFNGHCLSFIPIDLNCLLYKYETDFARAHDLFGEVDTADVWRQKAEQRARVVNEELWNEELGFYFDLNYATLQHSEIWSLAGFYALWSGLASPNQAVRIVANLEKFIYQGGLATTSSPHNDDHRPFSKQWAYPNGWAPLHWLTALGLKRYGYNQEAEYVARKWLKTNLDYFNNFGVFREAYNVVSPLDKPEEGLYPSQTGFGWTNAVFLDLAKQFLTKEELQKV